MDCIEGRAAAASQHHHYLKMKHPKDRSLGGNLSVDRVPWEGHSVGIVSRGKAIGSCARHKRKMTERVHCNTDIDFSNEGARVEWAEGGRLLKLKFRRSPASEWNGELFYNRGGTRQACKGFSFGSRRRLLDRLNTVSKGAAMPYFLTLTLPDDVFNDSCTEFAKSAKVWLFNFFKRLERVSPRACGFWRIEWKARESGQHVGTLFPHFHALVWNLDERKLGERYGEKDGVPWVVEDWEAFVHTEDPQMTLNLLGLWSDASRARTDWKARTECLPSGRVYAGSGAFVARASNLEVAYQGAMHAHKGSWETVRNMGFQDWASLAWYHVVGSGNLNHLQAGARVERVRTWGGVMAYCAKYLAKSDSGFLADVPLGRSWGIFNRELIPWAKLVTLEIDSEVGVRLRRIARHYLSRRLGRTIRAPYGLTLYCNADAWRRLWEQKPPDPF